MSKELLLVMEAVANEKGVPRGVIIEAMEAALASAAKKRYHEQDVSVRVAIDPKDGSYETFRRWEVVADDVVMESPDRQIRLMDAVDEKEGAEVGDYVEEQVENAEFGRIAAQAAKQVIVQRVREAERAQVVDAWKDRVGELINGIVKRVERGNVYVDLGGNAEALIPKDKAIPRDVLRFVPGGPEVGRALVADPRIAGVAFTGSTATAKAIARSRWTRARANAPKRSACFAARAWYAIAWSCSPASSKW